VPFFPARLLAWKPIDPTRFTLPAKKIPDAVFRTEGGIIRGKLFVEGDHDDRIKSERGQRSKQGLFCGCPTAEAAKDKS